MQQQQAKPGDPPLKAALTNNHQSTTNQASALTNCGSSGPVGAVGGERSPQRADEQNLTTTTTGGPENGEQRLVEVAAAATRENGATENGPTNDQNHRQDDHQLNNDLEEDQKESQEDEESEALRLKKELLQQDQRIRLSSPNDEEGTKEHQTTIGLLRVKKEEELQEPVGCPRPTSTPNLASAHINNNNLNSNNNNGPTTERSASTPPKKEGIFCVPSYVLGRRQSPPPEDWKPLDKCYFCLDGKLQHDEQTPHDEQPPLVSTYHYIFSSLSINNRENIFIKLNLLNQSVD